MEITPNRAANLFCLLIIADLLSSAGFGAVIAIINALTPIPGDSIPEMYTFGGKLTIAGKLLLPVVMALLACFTIKRRPLISLFSFIAYLFFVYVGASLWPVPEYTTEFREFFDNVIAEIPPMDATQTGSEVLLFSHPYWFSPLLYIGAGMCLAYVLYAGTSNVPTR